LSINSIDAPLEFGYTRQKPEGTLAAPNVQDQFE
jgi:hypothetical protein